VHPVLFHLGPILIPSYGATAALGVVLALLMAQHTARVSGLNPARIWNLSVIALFAALIASRLLLIVVNWSVLRLHPAWMLGLAMIHHPLLAVAGALAAAVAALLYARRCSLPLRETADALAPAVAIGLACEQIGAFLAGSDYGTESSARWAVTYSSVLAAQWSGTPLGLPLHPVQLYAALAYLTLAILLLLAMPVRRRPGDIAGLALMGAGVAVFMTELWRDPQGRGAMLGGAVDGPQAAAVAMVLLGAALLKEHNGSQQGQGPLPMRGNAGEPMRHGEPDGPHESNEAAHG
jgi:phosphatidylglycerol:prolipoprotein diacylglycerol transferase